MKKILSATIGIILGLVISAVTVFYLQENRAHSAITWWDEAVAYGDLFDWNDVFSPTSQGEDLYVLIYDKLMESSGRDALTEVAKNFGLTKEETDTVLNGSITPIYQNPRQKSARSITQEEAFLQLQEIQEQYDILKELFQIQSEVEVAVTPSELFANNDLSDSGFDLIYDLSLIEEILFMEIEPNTVGDAFGNPLTSPYLPTDDDFKQEFYIADEGPAAILGIGDVGGFAGGYLYNPVNDEGDSDIEVLSENNCPEDNPVENALDTFDAQAGNTGAGDGADIDELLARTDDNDDGSSDGDFADMGGLNTEGELEPAIPDNWGSTWCPGVDQESGAAAYGSNFGDFKSAGNVIESVLSLNQSAGAAVGYQSPAISAHLGVCFQVESIEQTLSSYVPGQSCVLCEVEQINDLMDKTLLHSLIPNKATGNLMESAKCKDAYGTLLDLNFIALSAPITTPPNDELIFGNNIFDEWNKFVDRYQPLLLNYAEFEEQGDFFIQYAPPDTTAGEVLNKINRDIAKARADAMQEIEGLKIGNDAANIKEFLQVILTEMRQMRTFFSGYNELYDKIHAACSTVKDKSVCQ